MNVLLFFTSQYDSKAENMKQPLNKSKFKTKWKYPTEASNKKQGHKNYLV